MYSSKILKNTYYLPYKSKCLNNVNNRLPNQSYNLHYFVLSSYNPFSNNEIHLIEYNDQSLSIRNVEIFDHNGEIEQMVCLDMYGNEDGEKKVLICTSGFCSSGGNTNRMNINDMKYSCSLFIGHINNLDEKEYNENYIEEMTENVEREEDDIRHISFEDGQKREQRQLDEVVGVIEAEKSRDAIEARKAVEAWDAVKARGVYVDRKVDTLLEKKGIEETHQNINKLEENQNSHISNDMKEKEIRCELNISSRNNGNIKKVYLPGEKKKVPLNKLCDLKRSKEYDGIKNIAVDNYEKEFHRIAIIDKYSYNIFEKNKNDMNLIQSNNLKKELNYGVFDPHHENILAVISDIYIYGYDIKSNKEIFSAYTNHKSNLTSIDFNPNIPNVIISSSNDGFIKFWDLRYLKNSFLTINIHSHWVTSLNFNNYHDELLLTTSTDNTVKLHKIEYPNNLNLQKKETNYKLIKTYTDHEESVYKGIWSKTDAWVFASLSYDGKCVVNTVPTEQKYKILL
ncbi:protein TSSC1 [Plasmodium brasilianum]|uniref:Protein TSSC1, putative n=2 Tax=Plasmodium (Plasmodium) TaxID=418103 RepID=A0A1A8WCV2_PLAMA|nr:protein TSSC1 [Plasmodium brasilianum]SBS90846.1 protein TSSC1, putative [Plasmodium malariae]